MKKDEKIAHLANVPLFSGFSRRDLGLVARHLDQVDVAEGTELTTEGQESRQFGIIVDGSAIVRRNKRKLADLGPGDFFGEMALLLRQKASASVTTTSDSEILVMRSRDFGRLLDDVPALSRKLAVGLAERLLEADRKLTV